MRTDTLTGNWSGEIGMKPNLGLILIAALAEELGEGALHTPKERARFQKKIYLLQLKIVQLNYNFSIDMHGLHSETLAWNVGLFRENEKEIRQRLLILELNEKTRDIIRDVSTCFLPPLRVECDGSLWLEVLTLMHFLAQHKLDTSPEFKSSFESNRDGAWVPVARELNAKTYLPVNDPDVLQAAWKCVLPLLSVNKRSIAA